MFAQGMMNVETDFEPVEHLDLDSSILYYNFVEKTVEISETVVGDYS